MSKSKIVNLWTPVKVNIRPLRELMSFGNRKLPKTTGIFNMGPASQCPSLALGLCQAFVEKRCVCYAMKAQRLYPNVLPYRESQQLYWETHSAAEFVSEIRDMNKRKRNKLKAIRFNEAGDFWDQSCVKKADDIAIELAKDGISCYAYTARKDLNFSRVKVLKIRGSGFVKKGILGEFKMIETKEDKPKGYALCPGDCRICDMCLRNVKSIAVLKH